MGIRDYLALRKARGHLKDIYTHAGPIYRMRRDIMPEAAVTQLRDAREDARRVRRHGTREEVARATGVLKEALSGWAPLHRSGWTENFEVLVVALGVAMAFRCYFFQPFKIPTGSMQPTLYGIHSEERDAPAFFDKPILKQLKWLVTGDWYREVRVVAGGEVMLLPGDDSKPGYTCLRVAGRRYYVPSDVVMERRSLRVSRDGRIEPGAVLWSGVVHSGDHVFVNRVVWNFRRPRRGEVMVFSTLGIAGLPQGTHYIKRMTGLPGETIGIRPPELLVNGAPVTEPFTIGRIVRREKLAPWAPPYAGYLTIGTKAPVNHEPAPRLPGDAVPLGAGEYYAMGDNTGNSLDSRYWGPVPERNLLGPPSIVYWPFTSPRFGRID